MKMKFVALLAGAMLISGMSVTANATDIQNGGFESGSLEPWTSTGQTSITNTGFDERTNHLLSTVGVGTHSAMVGDNNIVFFDDQSSSSSISQSWTKSSTFDHLYFNWAAVALVPNNAIPHTQSDTPWFQILVKDTTTDSTLFSKEYFTGNIGSIFDGWLQGATDLSGFEYGFNAAGIWYYRQWEQFDLSLATIADNDVLSVTLTTRDCTLGGHSSYAYLDGFGSVPQPIDNNPVPEPSTFLLFGAGLGGFALWRRKRS